MGSVDLGVSICDSVCKVYGEIFGTPYTYRLALLLEVSVTEAVQAETICFQY